MCQKAFYIFSTCPNRLAQRQNVLVQAVLAGQLAENKSKCANRLVDVEKTKKLNMCQIHVSFRKLLTVEFL